MKTTNRNNFTQLAERELAYSVPQFTNLSLHAQRGPLVFQKGYGVYLEDEHGKKYLEGMSGLWSSGLGYTQPRLVDAVTKQLEKLPYSHLFNHRNHVSSIELAEKLAEIAPVPGMRSFFVNSGSEAVDAAIKIAWFTQQARGHKKRHKILVRQGAYHGSSVAGAALTGLDYAHKGFELPMQHVVRLSTPHFYREGLVGESESQFCQRLVDELEAAILREGADTIAAFFAEPVMGAGGVLLPPEGYFPAMQSLLRRYGILCVSDEVICGLGRTGNWWGCQTFGYEPDLVCSAKQLSASFLPIGAVLVAPNIYADLEQGSAQVGLFGTGHTWGGHPACAAVALEAVNIYRELDVPAMVSERAVQMKRRLNTLLDHPHVGHVRSVGLLGGFELIKDKSKNHRFDLAEMRAVRLVEKALELGLILRALPQDCVGICPPMIIAEEDLDALFDRLEEALACMVD